MPMRVYHADDEDEMVSAPKLNFSPKRQRQQSDMVNKTEGEKAKDSHKIKSKGAVQPRTFKVVVIGDMSVGKTCLIWRLCSGTFFPNTESTIGVDFREKSLVVEGENVKLQLWDTAGQERFRRSMVPHYYRNVDAVVFVYDVTRKSSFDNLEGWIQEFQTYSDSKRVPQIMIGNKCDLHADRQVRTSEVKSLANHFGMPSWETSAKSNLENDTVEVIFQALAESLHLQTPLLDFQPAYSSVINLRNKSGLSMNQSIVASNSSPSHSVSDSEKAQPVTGKKKCCHGIFACRFAAYFTKDAVWFFATQETADEVGEGKVLDGVEIDVVGLVEGVVFEDVGLVEGVVFEDVVLVEAVVFEHVALVEAVAFEHVALVEAVAFEHVALVEAVAFEHVALVGAVEVEDVGLIAVVAALPHCSTTNIVKYARHSNFTNMLAVFLADSLQFEHGLTPLTLLEIVIKLRQTIFCFKDFQCG
eukprot:gene7328-8146_t